MYQEVPGKTLETWQFPTIRFAFLLDKHIFVQQATYLLVWEMFRLRSSPMFHTSGCRADWDEWKLETVKTIARGSICWQLFAR